MVTIAVLAVIVSIAAPTISRQLADQRVKSTASTLLNVLREVRAESSINKMPVTVSYINGMRPKNIINIEAPYSGLNVFSSQTSTQDWTNLFMKSASALALPPLGSDSNGGGTGTGGTGTGGTGTGGTGTGGTGTGGTGTGGTDTGGTGTGGTGTGGTGTGGTDTGGTGTGGTGTGGTDTGGTGSGNPTGENLVIIQTYNYDEKSIIKSSVSTNKIVFKPNGTVNQAVTYTICDSNKSASPIQVIVSSKGIISSKPGGVCE